MKSNKKNHGEFPILPCGCLSRISPWLRVVVNTGIGIAIFFLMLDVTHAAEDTIRGSTASTHPHPELAVQGIHKDGFTFYPEVTYLLTHDDNVFATEDNTESSFVSEFTPKISAFSNWTKHGLNFSASTSHVRNHDFSSEDADDWNVQTDGSLDIGHDIKLSGGASLSQEHIERGTPDDERGVEPTEFERTRIFARYNQIFGRISSNLRWSFEDKQYEDVDAIRLGVPITIDNSDRDREETRVKYRLGYQYVGDEEVFISIESIDRDYDKDRALTGLDHSSNGREILVGSSFDYHGVLLGEVSAGYRNQDYNNPLPDINTPVLEATVEWNITDLTTASLTLDQSINESINQVSSGYISRSSELSLDHELTRNLILNLSYLYIRDDYESTDLTDREDTTHFLIAGTTYNMNRYLSLSLQYSHEDREEDFDTTVGDSQFNFTRDLISLQLQAQL